MSKYYPLGFTTNLVAMAGSIYTPPASTNTILALTNATLIFRGGNLAEDATIAVTVLPGSKAVPVEALPKLSLGFTLSSGLFKGSYTPTNAGAKAVNFAGAVLQKSTNAAGHFLGTNQSGNVSLQAAP